MRDYAAEVLDGVVVRVIVGDATWAADTFGGDWVPVADVFPGVGWLWDGATFASPFTEPPGDGQLPGDG